MEIKKTWRKYIHKVKIDQIRRRINNKEKLERHIPKSYTYREIYMKKVCIYLEGI